MSRARFPLGPSIVRDIWNRSCACLREEGETGGQYLSVLSLVIKFIFRGRGNSPEFHPLVLPWQLSSISVHNNSVLTVPSLFQEGISRYWELARILIRCVPLSSRSAAFSYQARNYYLLCVSHRLACPRECYRGED